MQCGERAEPPSARPDSQAPSGTFGHVIVEILIQRSRRSPPCCQHRCRARRFSSRSKNKDFREICSGSKESSYSSSCYSYHSTLGSTKKGRKRITLGDECTPLAREAALEGFGRAGEEGGALSLSCEAMRQNRLLQN